MQEVQLTDFDPNWPHGHVTRGGLKARILCANAKGAYPIIALITDENGTEFPNSTTYNGTAHGSSSKSDYDLFNAPAPKRIMYVNFYRSEGGFLHSKCFYSKEKARQDAHQYLDWAVAAVAVPVELPEDAFQI
ncbi:MAG: hypothetical protein KGI54_15355 [Pseudomonadota bacterium]|nr:hypothetical protein [Pseudomonadota bacterium]